MPSFRLFPKIGLPQIAALVLLLLFLAQSLWFMANVPITQMESSYIEDGLLHVDRLLNAGTDYRSPLIPVLAGVPARLIDSHGNFVHLSQYRFLIRLPFLLSGLLLGASLWYVARRLYGNFGGYIALGLYCFSPMVITRSSQVQPDIVGAWGAFGLVFTAIAAAHTLYAPRDVILWNWKRIVLMAISIALCVGSQWSLWIVLLPALAFMLWVGHVRPAAVLSIFGAACALALFFLWGIASFRPAVFAEALRSAHWIEFSPAAGFRQVGAYVDGTVLSSEWAGHADFAVVLDRNLCRLEACTLLRQCRPPHRCRVAHALGSHHAALRGIALSFYLAAIPDPLHGRGVR